MPRASVLPGLVRACHPEPTVAVTAVGAALAVASGRDLPGVLAVTVTVLAGQLATGWCNDWVDAPRDRAADRRGKPIVAGRVPVQTVRAAALVAVVAVVPLAFFSGWRAGLAHTGAVALAWAYDLGWKATRLSVVAYAGAFALLPAFVTLGLPRHPWPPWEVLAAGALLGAGAHLANALPDLATDLRQGVRGVPQRLGPARSRVGSALLLLAATLVLVLGRGGVSATSLALLAVAVAGVAAVLVVGRAPGSPAAFRVAILLAVLDVGLLVARGRALI